VPIVKSLAYLITFFQQQLLNRRKPHYIELYAVVQPSDRPQQAPCDTMFASEVIDY